MQLQQLYYFKKIGELENITKASESLFISQPSLSNMIKRMEKELNAKLIYKNGRNIKLTEQGEILYKYAINILGELDNMKKELDGVKNTCIERINLASHNSIYLNSWLDDFVMKFPEYTVTHYLLNAMMMEKKLLSDEIDFALTTEALLESFFESHYLTSDHLVLIVPSSHPFASKDGIYFKEASKENFLALALSDHYTRLIDNIASKAGFVPNIVFEGETSLLEKLCSSGSGCFIHLKSAAHKMDTENIAQVKLLDSFANVDLFLCWRKNKSFNKACRNFRNHITQWYLA